MGKFNTKSSGTKTVNLAGGEAYKQSPKLELVSILLTSMVAKEFYEKASDTITRLRGLIQKCDPLFAAKASIFARTKYGLRSITHVMASELAPYVSGKDWAKRYYTKTIYRPDDMLEIMAYHRSREQKLTGAMKGGFAKAFDKFDAYQIGKYRGENKDFKLIDMVNLTRPNPTDKNREALTALVNGTLRSGDTWEKKQTQAGQVAKSEEEKKDLKADAWRQLLIENKLGYFALLRNLRNIIQQAPDMIDKACELLVNEKVIKKSLVLPFRYVTALKEITELNDDGTRKVIMAINKAVDIACSNVPKFDGKTLVVADFSGSMGSDLASYRGQASLFGTILAKSNDADLMIFGHHAAYVNYNPMDSTLSIVKHLFTLNNYHGYGAGTGTDVGHGTDFKSIFKTANKAYDRIVIFSDMQGWVGHYSPVREFNSYKERMHANPYIYSVDLAGHGSMQFPDQMVTCMAGFSEKMFDTMKFIETDKNALINEIEKVEI